MPTPKKSWSIDLAYAGAGAILGFMLGIFSLGFGNGKVTAGPILVGIICGVVGLGLAHMLSLLLPRLTRAAQVVFGFGLGFMLVIAFAL